MTTKKQISSSETCPAQALLKTLAGKWKPEIFRLTVQGPVRFSELLRTIEGSNKQSLAVALRELEEAGILTKKVIQEKPLHIEYSLSEKGTTLVPILEQLEKLG